MVRFFLFSLKPQRQKLLSSNKKNSYNLRGFFEACFPTLLREVFGFDGSCWLAQAARPGREGEAAAGALLRLLDPEWGSLLRAVRAVDAEGAVLFSFPVERLPGRTQLLLESPTGRAALNASWPQYQGRLSSDSSVVSVNAAAAAAGGGGGTNTNDAHGNNANNNSGINTTVVLLDAFGYYIHWVAYFAPSASAERAAAGGGSRSRAGGGDGCGSGLGINGNASLSSDQQQLLLQGSNQQGASFSSLLGKPAASGLRSSAARALGAAIGAATTAAAAAVGSGSGGSDSASALAAAAASAPWSHAASAFCCPPYQRLVADLLEAFLPHAGSATATANAGSSSSGGIGVGGIGSAPGGIFSLGGGGGFRNNGNSTSPSPLFRRQQLQQQQHRQPRRRLSAADAARGRVLASTFVEFWLSDCNEPEPAAIAAAAAAIGSGGSGIGGSARGMRGGSAGALGGFNPNDDDFLASLGFAGTAPARCSPPPPLHLPGPPFAFPYEPPSDEVAASVATLAKHLALEKRGGPAANEVAASAAASSDATAPPPQPQPLPALALSPAAETALASVAAAAASLTPGVIGVPSPSSTYLSSWLPPLPPAAPPLPRASGARPVPPPPRLVGAAGSPAPQAFARSLYRFLRRGLENWPPAPKAMTPLVDAWLAFAAPWAPEAAAVGMLQQGSSVSGLTAPLASTSHHHHQQQQHRVHFARPLSAAAEGITQRLSAAVASAVEHQGGGGSAAGNVSGSSRPGSAAAAAFAASARFFGDLFAVDGGDDDKGFQTHFFYPDFSAADWAPHVLAFSPLWSGILPLFIDCCCARLRASAAAAEDALASATAATAGVAVTAATTAAAAANDSDKRSKNAKRAARNFLLSPASQHPPPSWILRDLVRVLRILHRSRGLVKLLEAAEAAAAEAAAAAAARSAGSGAGGLGPSAAEPRHRASPLAAFGAGVLLLDDSSSGLGTFLVDQAREWDASAEAAPGKPPVVPTTLASVAPPLPPPPPYYGRTAVPPPSTTPPRPSAFGDDEEWGAAARVRDAVAAAEAAAAAWSKVLPHASSSPPPQPRSRANSTDDLCAPPPPAPPVPPPLSSDFELAAVRALRAAAEAALPAYGAVVARERARRAAADAAAGGGVGLRRRKRSDSSPFDDGDQSQPPPSRLLRRARPADVARYRGDWMLRPVQGNEVDSLARLLVKISVAANRALGLSGPSPSASPKPCLGSPWLDAARDAAAKRGLRVNLRPLAEKATLLWLPVLFLSLKFSLWLLRVAWVVLTTPYEPGEWEVQSQQWQQQQQESVAATMVMNENE